MNAIRGKYVVVINDYEEVGAQKLDLIFHGLKSWTSESNENFESEFPALFLAPKRFRRDPKKRESRIEKKCLES